MLLRGLSARLMSMAHRGASCLEVLLATVRMLFFRPVDTNAPPLMGADTERRSLVFVRVREVISRRLGRGSEVGWLQAPKESVRVTAMAHSAMKNVCGVAPAGGMKVSALRGRLPIISLP